MDIYSVYWIRRKDHNNILSEGYVGITNNIDNRMKQHKKSKNIVGKAIRKYQDIVVDIIHLNISKKEALQVENNLRPVEMIGWNMCAGGNIPPIQKNTKRSNCKQSLRGENRTEKQKQASARQSIILKGRQSPNLNKAMSEEQKKKISHSLKGRKVGSPSEMHKKKLSDAAILRPKLPCPVCGVLATKQNLARYHKECSK